MQATIAQIDPIVSSELDSSDSSNQSMVALLQRFLSVTNTRARVIRHGLSTVYACLHHIQAIQETPWRDFLWLINNSQKRKINNSQKRKITTFKNSSIDRQNLLPTVWWSLIKDVVRYSSASVDLSWRLDLRAIRREERLLSPCAESMRSIFDTTVSRESSWWKKISRSTTKAFTECTEWKTRLAIINHKKKHHHVAS